MSFINFFNFYNPFKFVGPESMDYFIYANSITYLFEGDVIEFFCNVEEKVFGDLFINISFLHEMDIDFDIRYASLGIISAMVHYFVVKSTLFTTIPMRTLVLSL